MIAPPPSMICFPPAALNGGRLEHAPAKVGQWVWQPKVDDRRVVIHTPTRTVWNQYGQLSVAHRDLHKFEVALDGLATLAFAAEWLDAGLMEYRHDMMRGSIIVFDVIQRGMSFNDRRALLQTMFEVMPLTIPVGLVNERVFLIPTVWGEEAGRALYADLQIENAMLGHKHNFYEGVVAKRASSLYTMGRKAKQETPDWIKHRFDQ